MRHTVRFSLPLPYLLKLVHVAKSLSWRQLLKLFPGLCVHTLVFFCPLLSSSVPSSQTYLPVSPV